MNNINSFELPDDNNLSIDLSLKNVITYTASAIGFIGVCWLFALTGAVIGVN
jgi:hypothetical protein